MAKQTTNVLSIVNGHVPASWHCELAPRPPITVFLEGFSHSKVGLAVWVGDALKLG